MNLDIPLRDSKIYSVRGKNLHCEIKIFYNIFCNNMIYLNFVKLFEQDLYNSRYTWKF